MPQSLPSGYAKPHNSLGRSQSSVSGSQDDAVRDRADCVQCRVYLGRLFSVGGAGWRRWRGGQNIGGGTGGNPVQLGLEDDDLLDHVVGNVERDRAPVDHQRGRLIDAGVDRQFDVGVDDVLGGLGSGAGDDGVPVESGALGRGPQQACLP